mmetsp:Transcript_108112/g.187627  ORF Transcript_108112/g.187627 Transcript_108112/m.187627 type:complete len:690 (+) Transcript_108112:127-2196(+)
MTTAWMPNLGGKINTADQQHAHIVHGSQWYEPYNFRKEQEELAKKHLNDIMSKVDELYKSDQIAERKWTNDPMVFPMVDSENFNNPYLGIVPFPPHDQQFYLRGFLNPLTSQLNKPSLPAHNPDVDHNSSWVRLCDFNQNSDACHVFAENGQGGDHYGRVFQGSLDTGYLVEAMTALSLRPKLARHLFYCYNVARSIYIVRLYKHGQWVRIEVDDYVPVGTPTEDEFVPVCARSEHFPVVLWPSLVEKAVAKLFTRRGALANSTDHDKGGWEALGGGGRVEDALVMLTGGVAGRFQTKDVSADRLFLYLYERQRDTLFVCRVNEPACTIYNVSLNPYYPYAVNRAVAWEGRLYVQVFCGAPTLYDGGLQDLAVPYSLLHCPEYKETASDGFFWCDINDFHLYFDTIFECHLVNTPDCGIPHMPEPRIVPQPMTQHDGVIMAQMGKGMGKGAMDTKKKMLDGRSFGVLNTDQTGTPLLYYETVWCCSGQVDMHNEPEFQVFVPANIHGVNPTEIIISVDQYDQRMNLTGAEPPPGIKQDWLPTPSALLLKVYEGYETSMDLYRDKLVCKSNWLPINHAMVMFKCKRGGSYKITCEFPDHNHSAEKLVFRCYSSIPGVEATAATATARHKLVRADDDASGVKWTLVGSMPMEYMENPDTPPYFNTERDCLRKAEFDKNTGMAQLSSDCSVM